MASGKQNVKAASLKDKLDVFSNPANAHLYFTCKLHMYVILKNIQTLIQIIFTICRHLNLEYKFWFYLEEQFPRVLNFTGAITIKEIFFTGNEVLVKKLLDLENNIWLGNDQKTALLASNGTFLGNLYR